MVTRWEERELPKVRPFLKMKVEFISQKFMVLFSGSRLSPNILTTTGLLLSGFGSWTITQGRHSLAGSVIFLAGLFDLFDGALARAKNSSNSFGAFYDSTVDRFSEALIYLGIVIYFLQQGDSLAIILGYLTLVGSFMVSYTRARAEGLGYRCRVGWMTRPERIITLSLGLLVHQLKITLWVLVVLTNITIFQRIYFMWINSREKKGDAITVEKKVPSPRMKMELPVQLQSPKKSTNFRKEKK